MIMNEVSMLTEDYKNLMSGLEPPRGTVFQPVLHTVLELVVSDDVIA